MVPHPRRPVSEKPCCNTARDSCNSPPLLAPHSRSLRNALSPGGAASLGQIYAHEITQPMCAGSSALGSRTSMHTPECMASQRTSHTSATRSDVTHLKYTTETGTIEAPGAAVTSSTPVMCAGTRKFPSASRLATAASYAGTTCSQGNRSSLQPWLRRTEHIKKACRW
jgi:hypothetical protein